APSLAFAAIFRFAQQSLTAVWDQTISQLRCDRTPHRKKLRQGTLRMKTNNVSTIFVFLHRGMVSQSANDSVGYVLRERFRVSRSHPFSLQLGESRSIIELALPCTRFRLGQLQCPHSRRFPRDPALPIPALAKSKFRARVLRLSLHRRSRK